MDIIAASTEGPYDHVYVYYGNGHGKFSAPAELLDFAARPLMSAAVLKQSRATNSAADVNQLYGFTVGDFENIGRVDSVAAFNDTNGTSAIYLLPDYSMLEWQPGGGSVGSVGAGDFNGDGVLDVAGSWLGHLVSYLSSGGGNFTAITGPVINDSESPLAIADFDGDGVLDIAITNSNSFAVYIGNSNGTFTAKAGQPVTAQPNIFLTTADFNGDGIPDLAALDSSNVVSIYLGNGDGTFQPGIDTTGRGDGFVAFGDFNADGRLDVAITDSVAGTVSVILQAPVGGLSTNHLSFPNQKVGTTSTPLQVMLSNSGSAPMNISNVQISGDFQIKTNQNKQLLQPGKTDALSITFTPTALGPRTGVLTFTDTGTNSPQVVNLSGTGTSSAAK